MLGGVVKDEATGQMTRFGCREGVVQHCWGVNVEGVNDQINALSSREMLVSECSEKRGEIGFGAAGGDAESTPTAAWLNRQKQIGGVVSFIFVIHPFG